MGELLEETIENVTVSTIPEEFTTTDEMLKFYTAISAWLTMLGALMIFLLIVVIIYSYCYIFCVVDREKECQDKNKVVKRLMISIEKRKETKKNGIMIQMPNEENFIQQAECN